MREPAGTRPSPVTSEDRLDSWKEIASYLDRDVTTVQRWEKREGMPVHRHLHGKMGSVYAYRTELDAWTRSRNPQAVSEDSEASAVTVSPQRASGSRSRWQPAGLTAAAIAAVVAIGAVIWLLTVESHWRDPTADARIQAITDFDGVESDAAISRDGKFVAFLSDRDGQMDVWVTQLGSGQFHNLTRGNAAELVNRSIRTLAFSPDGSLVTFWVRKQGGSATSDISIWAVPTLGGQPRPYLEGAAEYDWSQDGTQLIYHTPEAGDPLFAAGGSHRTDARLIFSAPAGMHSHFPLWSPDRAYIYFVYGQVPDKLDIWRIAPSGGKPERITSHAGPLSHPVFLDHQTLMYLAGDSEGPALYSTNLQNRTAHKLSAGLERYTSLAASADGRRLVLTRASPKRTLWRLPITNAPARIESATRISLTTNTGYSPRLGPGYLLYVSATGGAESIWKIADGTTAELWRGGGARILGGPAISPDGKGIAFSVHQEGKNHLYVMQADGSNVRVVNNSLILHGAPAWAPDGQSITAAVEDEGIIRLYRVPLDGRPPGPLVKEYSLEPAWSPDGSFVIYSGRDIGTTFPVKAATTRGEAHALPALTLTRGARRLAFMPGGSALVILRGDMHRKNLWLFDLKRGVQRQLTDLDPDFDVRNFDISPDGHEIVLERVQEHSDVVMMDLVRR